MKGPIIFSCVACMTVVRTGVHAFTAGSSLPLTSSAPHSGSRSSYPTVSISLSAFPSSAFPEDSAGDAGGGSEWSTRADRQAGSPRNRHTEFTNLGEVEESTERQRRREEESRIGGRFAKFGDDLWALRRLTARLSHKLAGAIGAGLRDREEEIRGQLRRLEGQDPELVYGKELESLQAARREGRDVDAQRHGQNAWAARSCLPQYNLDGLWVGK
jgi:hypothetical protein